MAGLPWIQLHVDLPRHPKSVRLAVLLRDDRAWTYMAQLWLWCAEHVQDGRVPGKAAADTLEYAAGWRGEPGKLFDAAVDAGFLERDSDGVIVHGWEERARPHLAKRQRDAARAQAFRDEQKGVVSESSATPQRVVSDPPGKRESESKREIEKEVRDHQTAFPELQGAPSSATPASPATPLGEYIASAWKGKIPDIGERETAWRDAYPGVDLLAEAKKARAWEISNPRKVRPDKKRFLNSWFSRAQENVGRRGGADPPGKPAKKPVTQPPAPHSAFEQGGEVEF